MKYRRDYVTNSSSSSYIIMSNIDMSENLMEYMKEEYGKYGLSLMNDMVKTGKEIRENENCEEHMFCDDYDLWDIIEDNEYYLHARFIAWTNDGDTEDDDAWLYYHIPDKYKHDVYESSYS